MSDSQQAGNQAAGFRLAFLLFAPGVTRKHAWTFLYLNLMIMPIVSFLSFSQPYVLNEIVGIPLDRQGRLTGSLILMQEIVALLLVSIVGAMSDRFGRRTLYAIGVAIAAIGFALYGNAESEADLYAYRFVYAIGVSIAGVMIAVTAADYPAESSRGKLAGVTGLLNGLGVGLATALVASLPAIFKAQGFTSAEAGRYMLYVMAGLALITAVIMQWGLMGGVPTGRPQKVGLLRTLTIGVQQGMRNRRLVVCYAGSFIARADLTLVATFVSLFLQQAGRNEGLDPEEAIKKAGIMFAIIQTSSLLSAPVVGWSIDRYHRLTCLAVALFIGGVGYTILGLQEHPFGPMGILGGILVGVGQIAVILSVTGLLGQETPIDVRGSVIGLAGLCGAFGILLTSVAGGYLFDHWMISGPILLVGLANFAVFAMAFVVWLADGRPIRFDPSEAKSSDFAALGH